MPADRPAIAAVSRRDRILIWSCLLVSTVIAWAYLVHLDRQMSAAMVSDHLMAEMGMSMDRPWTASDLLFTFAMWSVMMVGMMVPSAAPVLLIFAGAHAQRSGRRGLLAVAMFAMGYFVVWTGFSAAAATAQWGLHEAAMLSPAMAAASPRLSGAILIVAGVYQLTPLKQACLVHCRSPLGVLMSQWREGPFGTFQMGARHGISCLGCCWALMCVLFAVGVMNLVWVAALTVFVLMEKSGPAGVVVARVAGAAMIAAGVLFAAGAVRLA